MTSEAAPGWCRAPPAPCSSPHPPEKQPLLWETCQPTLLDVLVLNWLCVFMTWPSICTVQGWVSVFRELSRSLLVPLPSLSLHVCVRAPTHLNSALPSSLHHNSLHSEGCLLHQWEIFSALEGSFWALPKAVDAYVWFHLPHQCWELKNQTAVAFIVTEVEKQECFLDVEEALGRPLKWRSGP